MSASLTAAVMVACLAIGTAAGLGLRRALDRRAIRRARGQRRILVPFTSHSLSRRGFDATISLARALDATIVPAFLARVPRWLPLNAPLPAQADGAMALVEALEQRAARSGVAVDARVGRGRSYRDALHRLLREEQFDRIVVCAPDGSRRGLTHDDLRWLLTRVPAEIVILKPAPQDSAEIRAATPSKAAPQAPERHTRSLARQSLAVRSAGEYRERPQARARAGASDRAE